MGDENMLSILWTIIIGFIAGVIAKFVTPGEKEPQGFILTTALGILGAFVATYDRPLAGITLVEKPVLSVPS